MKTTIKNRVLLPLGMALLMLGATHQANAQTIDIGPNQYAFQFTDNNNFGLFFNSTDSRYEFRNGSAAPVFGFSALNGQMSTNLQFGAGTDYLVAPNRYAFRSSIAPGVGLYSTNNRIQFLNTAAEPVFSINVADGKFDTDIAFFPGKSIRVSPGQYGMRSAVLPNAGLLFGLEGFEFRTSSGGMGMYIDATTGDVGIGNTNPFSKLHVGGDLRLDGILYAANSINMAGWDVFADADQYAINENNVGTRIQVLPGGNVGLSTDAPTARLDVNGEARVRALPLDNTLDEVVVVDADGNLRKRDAATLGDGGSPWLTSGSNIISSNTGNVGVGSPSPTSKLEVFGGQSVLKVQSSSTSGGDTPFLVRSGGGSIEGLIVRANGNVGMGITTPNAKLDVRGSGALLRLESPTGTTAYQDIFSGSSGHLTIGIVGGGNGEQVGQGIIWNRKNSRLVFGTNDIDRMTIRNNGNVGIGTQAPTARLHVIGNAYIDGKIWGREVEVTLASFPDYVFKADYDLMSLNEVDAFIQANGHLPNMPTEAEVLENGLNLGDINVKLVEKVEELTLHLIEKDKEVKALEERLKALEQMMNPSSDK